MATTPPGGLDANSMSFDDWISGLQSAGYLKRGSDNTISDRSGRRYSTSDLQGQYNFWKGQSKVPLNGVTGPAQAQVAAGQATQDQLTQDIHDFYTHMNAPLDPNDPDVQRITRLASSGAETQARMAGIDGPLAVGGSEQATNNALGGLYQFRKGLASQAMGLANNRDLGLKNLQEQQYQFDQGLANDSAMSSYASGRDASKGLWGGIGGAVGGVAGGYFGGPAGAAAGMAAGSALGSAAAGGLYGPPPSYTPHRGYRGY